MGTGINFVLPSKTQMVDQQAFCFHLDISNTQRARKDRSSSIPCILLAKHVTDVAELCLATMNAVYAANPFLTTLPFFSRPVASSEGFE